MTGRCSLAAGHPYPEVSPIGDWHLDENDRWVYDPDAPTPGPGVTALAPRDGAYAAVFEHHGELHGRVDPEQFDLFDDDGPPDAA